MSDVELRDELFTMLAAGHETTSTGLAFAVDLLLHNPAALDRLRDELEAGEDAYLDAVVTETLRIRPVIDATERTLKAPRTVAGWDLPEGIRVYPGIALVHHRADLYPEPDRFRPERFLEEGARVVHLAPVRRRDPPLHRRRTGPGRDGRGAADDRLRESSWRRSGPSPTRSSCAGSPWSRDTAPRCGSGPGARRLRRSRRWRARAPGPGSGVETPRDDGGLSCQWPRGGRESRRPG